MKKLQILLILLLLPYLGFSQRLRPKMSPTDSLWGYANRDGRMVIDFKYDKAHYFNDDFAAVKKRGKWGLINKKGEVVINIKYEDIGTLKEGFVPVKKRGKWGLVDQNEKPNEKVQGYEELADFYPNPQLYYATKNGLKGMVDVDGKIHVPFQYDLVAPWEKGANVFVVFQDNKVGLLKSGGEPIIPVKYSLPIYYNPFRFDGDIAYFTEGTHFTLFDGNKWGVLDSYGKEIIPFDYDFIELFDDKKEYGKFQFALLIKDDKATLVGKDLKPVLDQELEYVYGFYGNNSNLLIIQFTDKIGFYDADKQQLVEEAPVAVWDTFGKHSVARIKNKQGRVSRFGELLVPIAYDHVRELDYKEPLATKRFVVKEGELVGIYQTKKGLAVPIKYKRVRSITTNELPCYAAQDPKTSKWALLSPTAKQLTDFEYNTINVHYKTKKIIVMKDGKKGELDHEGKVTWIE